MLKIDGVTHWSIPVNDLEESERFYRDLLGLEYRGRLGNSHMACFHVGGHDILLCERKDKLYRTPQQDNRLHHSFTLSPEEWEKAVRLLHERGVKIEELTYRTHGFFTGRAVLSRSFGQPARGPGSDLDGGDAHPVARRHRRRRQDYLTLSFTSSQGVEKAYPLLLGS